MNSKNITTLIPLHELSPVFTEWFNKCIKSIEQAKDKPGKILFICPKNNDFEKLVIKRSNNEKREELNFNDKEHNNSFKFGSNISGFPLLIFVNLDLSTSTPITWKPLSAKQTEVVSPT